jgi:hypothetical protein
MPQLTEIHIQSLQPLKTPFEGNPRKSIESDLLKGEEHNDEFLDFIHDGFQNEKPKQYVEITVQELKMHQVDRGGKYPEKCFLWVIDSVSVKLMWEKTPNERRGASRPDRPYVCHTNITGSKSAYIGGEMYFCEDGNIYLNFSSDRYGVAATEENKRMAKQYIEDCGYKNIIRTDNNL